MERFVVQEGDPILGRIARPATAPELVEAVAKKLIDAAYEIRSTIYPYPRGFEMAAPQIGEPYRIILLQGSYEPDPANHASTLLVNPEILEELEPYDNWEDCLSINGMRACVGRHALVRVRYEDAEGNSCVGEFRGDRAADVQHGVDHLNGRLFFDRRVRYFIPLSIYRPLKDRNVEELNEYVESHYSSFDPKQQLSRDEMLRLGLQHPRQCLLRKTGLDSA